MNFWCSIISHGGAVYLWIIFHIIYFSLSAMKEEKGKGLFSLNHSEALAGKK